MFNCLVKQKKAPSLEKIILYVQWKKDIWRDHILWLMFQTLKRSFPWYTIRILIAISRQKHIFCSINGTKPLFKEKIYFWEIAIIIQLIFHRKVYLMFGALITICYFSLLSLPVYICWVFFYLSVIKSTFTWITSFVCFWVFLFEKLQHLLCKR